MIEYREGSARAIGQVLEQNKTLRNTYLLLALSFLFSAFTAYVALQARIAPINPLIFLAGSFGLTWLIQIGKDSALGILAMFAFTGFMGISLGPILELYLKTFSNGSALISTAFAGTGISFLGLSAYAMNVKRDFSHLTGFLILASCTLIFLVMLSFFVQIPAINLAISGICMLTSGGYILIQTNELIKNRGEQNYILAASSLFISLYNFFISLLHILGTFSGKKD